MSYWSCPCHFVWSLELSCDVSGRPCEKIAEQVASCIGEFAVSSHMRDLLKDDIYKAAAWETKTESEIQDLLRSTRGIIQSQNTYYWGVYFWERLFARAPKLVVGRVSDRMPPCTTFWDRVTHHILKSVHSEKNIWQRPLLHPSKLESLTFQRVRVT